MALDVNAADRSYQFGRLLAVMEKVERLENLLKEADSIIEELGSDGLEINIDI